MLASRTGVGIIGIEAGRSWSAVAHVPALRALPRYEVVAVATRNQQSAEAAARACGIPRAFDDYRALISSPAVDLVVVAVKVPHHLELVRAAIEGGKSVYCEWPLGNGLNEAVEMAELARRKQIHTTVGLQARAAPVINYVRGLISQGYVGEVLSTTLVGSGMYWGPFVERSSAYVADRTNGATMLSIAFGHSIDALCYTLGEFSELSATLANRRSSTTIVESGDSIPMTAEDQIMVAGRLRSGATASIHFRGGTTRGTGFLWEINGTAGDLQISAIGGQPQIFDLSVKGATAADKAMRPLEIPPQYRVVADLTGPALNVAQTYCRRLDDIERGTQSCPGFEDAVVRHRLLAAVETSATTGSRVVF